MKWVDLVSLCTKSSNHLALLRGLYDKPIVLKRFKSVNYKTACRIMNSFLTEGLVKKSKDEYSLTNKGLLVSIIVLGEFKKLEPELRIQALVDPEAVYVERADTLQEVLYHLKLRQSVLILGESGLGKTTLLKHLVEDYLDNALLVKSRPPSMILEKLAGYYEISLRKRNRRKRQYELLDDLTKRTDNSLILVVDEVEDLTKASAKILKTLMRHGLIVLGAGLKLKHDLKFQQVKLRPLNKEEIASLVNQLLSETKVPREIISHLVNSNGNPELVSGQCQLVKVRSQQNDLRPKDFISETYTNKRVNIISKDGLVNLGYLLITLRYVFYGQKEYQIGYMLSTIAYLLFFFFRRRKKKK